MRIHAVTVFGIVACQVLLGVWALGDEPTAAVNPTLCPGDDAFITRQTEAFLAEAEATLHCIPPRIPEPKERTLALYLLDAVLHDTHSPSRAVVQRFYHERMTRAIEQIEQAPPKKGARIWKLYNHGFVVRTTSVTLAFDVFRGPHAFRWDTADQGRKMVPCPDFPLSMDLTERLVRQCDVLFVSHRHYDHADESVIKFFLDQGKPVVAPESVLEGSPVHASIMHLKREVHTLQPLPVQQGRRVLSVVVYPGQQYQDGGIPNNVVLVFTPEGLSFAHNGDQINDPYPAYQEDFKWIDAVRDHHRVDVLMTNCWTNDILRVVRGFNPRLVLPGHENELGHQMNDRVPYWMDAAYLKLNYPELKASDYPVLVMTWGESYHYKGRTP